MAVNANDLSQSLALLDRRRLRCNLYRHFDPITSKTWSSHCYRAHRSWPNDRFACIRSIRPVRRSRPSFEHVSVGGRSAASIRCHPRSALAQKPHVAFGSRATDLRRPLNVGLSLNFRRIAVPQQTTFRTIFGTAERAYSAANVRDGGSSFAMISASRWIRLSP
jgi:hypothetical protein